jgi:hypothetical protein
LSDFCQTALALTQSSGWNAEPVWSSGRPVKSTIRLLKYSKCPSGVADQAIAGIESAKVWR